MALAGDRTAAPSEGWRLIARQGYYVGLALAGISLLVFLPLPYDLRPSTLLSAAVVAAFLIVSEWPHRAGERFTAPLTAVIGACAMALGAWTIVLALLGVTAVRLRTRQKSSALAELVSTAYAGQFGLSVVATYCMIATWHFTTWAVHSVNPGLSVPVTLLGAIAVGLVGQAVHNVAAAIAFALVGRPVSLAQFVRVGVVASIYSYLLLAMYSFGGILAAAIFYAVVAQTRLLQDVLNITVRLNLLDQAKTQGRALAQDLIHLTDVGHVEFASEVQNIAEMMARRLGMTKKDVELVGLAAQLHEIGKSRLPATVREDDGLNAGQRARHDTYARMGGIMVRNYDALLPAEIADWIEYHSENFAGDGQPRGLKGEAIPVPSRIIRIARDYVRMLTGYDGAAVLGKETALAELRERCRTVYDPRLVDLLCDIVA
ncbi:MAG: HD domain-containing protein [Candidatus Eremiobacteraeota bacterium]|nr:HD domain-containing protein [Candidatus Eremiobacteraeota bacterium]